MPESAIPNTPSELTTAWLNQALRSTGTIKQASITSFTIDALGAPLHLKDADQTLRWHVNCRGGSAA